ncbi:MULTISPECIES: poly-beta-1,6-N-acetyl-D-glucosamine biosynthesis protein PgaD [Acinetobacter]|uniref:Poly-beta-1,6-N-acetyl-D-glucosamine biosynthesis protein PgaD n=1 Tax=Acinetobacter higginsii TaxID=70347 RepID=N9RM77_9GAMM|nr:MULTISPECIES: poly-beta-1,6-N-acetyl-D-glucosamine biosynthesis protein PgaD [Acinetobacter]ENX59053.1 poly-beta-1,6-N-acetyl-D-glucosamine biosynthesis protein PgaD [Acinetobacter higginsii]ENX59697.1 poly-beta-1,6-N-acetyl-D-glucosamine biosynthesis protein PgaD [Acinetobacter higginsii]MCH7318484.1 poly-beta-1,6-N-acetyl-D-glucosamine biosynthesis protein PgaD [Acinetobacter higginsii]MCH7379763.1 poly-beta-1,6-N-acetyl-D-glucosamine biosynthesis protein PgaD [Acinetobacter higginsii]MCJ
MNKSHLNIIEDVSQLDIPEYIDQHRYVKNKGAHYLLQGIGWALWTLLFLPLLAIFLWLYQGKLIKNYIFAEQMSVQIHNFFWLALMVMICCASLLLWASYNWLRYRNTEKTTVVNVSHSILAEGFLIPKDELSKIQRSKNIVLHYNQEGILADYELR